jgi:hypothetical protein
LSTPPRQNVIRSKRQTPELLNFSVTCGRRVNVFQQKILLCLFPRSRADLSRVCAWPASSVCSLRLLHMTLIGCWHTAGQCLSEIQNSRLVYGSGVVGDRSILGRKQKYFYVK